MHRTACFLNQNRRIGLESAYSDPVPPVQTHGSS
jgi:hypothetical protein